MNILIIKFSALGDIIIASPIIKQIQTYHSEDNICLLVSEPFAFLFDQWCGLNIHTMKRSGIKSFIAQINWIRKQKFDLVYDLQSNDRSGLLCALSGIPVRAGNHPRFPYNRHPNDQYIGQCHVFDRLNQVLESNNIPPSNSQAALEPQKKTRTKIRNWLINNNINSRKFCIMHAGSSPKHLTKRWPYFSELATQIKRIGIQVIWIGTGDEKKINHNLANIVGIDATDEFSIMELIALGDESLFAVTNDSAPMHILSCSSTTIISLFGPTNPRRNHALGHEKNVIFSGGKIPVDDRRFKPAVIDNITVTAVLEKVNQIIDNHE